jgi:hypothetical protein
MIRGEPFGDYASGFLLNDATWSGEGPLFVRYVEGEDRRRLLAAFPGRRLWIVDGASRAGGAPRLVAGPEAGGGG